MKYGIILKEGYTVAGYDDRDPSYTAYHDTLKSFDTEEALKRYLIENSEKSYGKDTIKQIIRYEELKANRTVSLELTS